MLKTILIAFIILLSSAANAQAIIYKINYFDITNNSNKIEIYSDLDDFHGRIEELNYNREIYQNVNVSKNIISKNKFIERTLTSKPIEHLDLIKRGGEGGGD